MHIDTTYVLPMTLLFLSIMFIAYYKAKPTEETNDEDFIDEKEDVISNSVNSNENRK